MLLINEYLQHHKLITDGSFGTFYAEKYETASKEEGEAVGVAVAKEMMAYTESFVDGYYFSFPFNRVYLLDKILSV